MKHKSASNRIVSLMAFALLLTTMAPAAFAAKADDPSQTPTACYPTAVTRSDDGTEIRKMYDLGPTDDPAGIPRSDFDQDGYHYELTDLLKQELPEHESRQHTETVSIASKSKDMAAVLSLLPQEREFITEDGLSGVLSLRLDTVKVTVAGYGNSTKELTASRTYPGLNSQDTSPIPKGIEDNGHTLSLLEIDWQRNGEVGEDGSERYTAVASYTGSTTSSYIKGYTVTADYTGTVSRINLNKTRYVAIFEGKAIQNKEEESLAPSNVADDDTTPTVTFRPNTPLVAGISVLVGICLVALLIVKRRKR
ncbi:MAG: cell wall anchor protein [Oscillospiraceae bacterium]|nr:cell wall anchor protein [Oscillospiraceae bacterium]